MRQTQAGVPGFFVWRVSLCTSQPYNDALSGGCLRRKEGIRVRVRSIEKEERRGTAEINALTWARLASTTREEG